MNSVERREGWVELTDPPVRAGFRVLTEVTVAGGPVELEFELVWLGHGPAYLAITTDRAAARLADYDFVASASGRTLADPAAGAEFVGGPATSVLLPPGEPFTQALPLERYVALAEAPPGPLELRCRRRVGIAASQEDALSAEPFTVEIDLVLALPRCT